MKFSEYINEAKEISLLGVAIKGHVVSQDTCTKHWPEDFIVYDHGLTTLKGAPLSVGGDFNCAGNRLTSLKYMSNTVGGYFYCDENKLTSLKGGPVYVGKNFDCSSNELTSLEGAPEQVYGSFDCNNNNLTSLKDIHKTVKKIKGKFHCLSNPIKSHVLGLLLIEGLTGVINSIKISSADWCDILNKYVGTGRKGLLDCQNELIEAGYEEFAQL